MATIPLENVKRIYDNEVTAVHDLNLEVADKEFIVLVGPSDYGKPTALRMITSLEDIFESDLVTGSKRMNSVELKGRDIAIVFQNYALCPHMTIYENMVLALKLRKMPRGEIDKKMRRVAKVLDTTQYLDHKPKALFGGQRQRVTIDRTIVHDPQVFLIDEPPSNLDTKLHNQMHAEVIELRQRINTTFIYVTCDQTEAIILGDRVVIMKGDFVQQIGTPQEVFDRSASLFAASFIDSPQMNFFDGELEKKDDEYQLKVGEVTMALNSEAQELLAGRGVGERRVTVDTHPKYIALATAPSSDTVFNKADMSKMMDSEIYLHISIIGRDMVPRVPTAGLLTERWAGIPYGTEISFIFRPELIHLFDPETEKNPMYRKHCSPSVCRTARTSHTQRR